MANGNNIAKYQDDPDPLKRAVYHLVGYSWLHPDQFETIQEVSREVERIAEEHTSLTVERDRYQEALELVLDFYNPDTQSFVAKHGHGMTTRDMCDRIRTALTAGQR